MSLSVWTDPDPVVVGCAHETIDDVANVCTECGTPRYIIAENARVARGHAQASLDAKWDAEIKGFDVRPVPRRLGR